jgi:hypothetical protein
VRRLEIKPQIASTIQRLRNHRRGLSLEYRSATSAAQTAAADWYIEPSMRAYLRAHARVEALLTAGGT